MYARVNIPFGTYATTYSGLATAVNNTATTSDTVRIYVTVLPSYDLDISDNTGNLVQNRMTLSSLPGTDVNGYFVLINPNTPELNVDPDMYGNADLTNITYTVDDLMHVTNPLAYIPSAQVTLSIVPIHNLASGASEHIITNVSIPQDQFEGEYNTWVRVIDTEREEEDSIVVKDSFLLRVIVGLQEDVDIVEDQVSGTTPAGDTIVYITDFTVVNPDTSWNPDPDGPSNMDLYNLRFSTEVFRDTTDPSLYLLPNQIYVAVTGLFGPTPIEQASIGQLALGDTAYVQVYASISRGTHNGNYRGQIQVQDDDGWPSDVVSVMINILPYYDLDISDNERYLVNNTMTLTGAMGTTHSGHFRIVNPNTPALNLDPDQYGNADFTEIVYGVDSLLYVPIHGEDIRTYIPRSALYFFDMIDSLKSGQSYDVGLGVRIPYNQLAGWYRGSAWAHGRPLSPGTPNDLFTLEVYVGPVEDLDIDSSMVHATTNQGTAVNTTPFNVYSTDSVINPDPLDGYCNTTLYGINFSSTDLRDASGTRMIAASNVSFVPVLIESLAPGTFKPVYARVNVPFGTYATTYSGIATAQNNSGSTMDTVRIFVTVNPYYDLDIADNAQGLIENKMRLAGAMGSTQYGVFRMVNPNSAELNVDPDQYGNADFTSFAYSVDTLKYVPVTNEDINYTIPPSAVTLTLPLGLASGVAYDARATVIIPMNTFSGTYRAMVRVTGTPGEPGTPTDSFMFEVFVGPVDDIDIDSAAVHAGGAHGTVATTTTFRVYSTDATVNPDPDGPGNTTLYGVSFSSVDLRDATGNLVIPAANVSFVPVFIDSIKPAQSYPVYARVNIPYGTFATTYSGLATTTNIGGTTSDTVRIYVTVSPYYDLDISDNEANLITNKMHLAGAMGTAQSGYFRMINPNSAELNVDPDQYGNANFTSFTATVETLRYIPVGPEDINYIIPPSAVIFTLPSGLASGAMYDARALVNIPTNTFNGLYRGLVTVTGTPSTPGTPTDQFMLEVLVGPVDDLDIDSLQVHASGAHGTMATTTPFRVYSTDATVNPDPDGPGNTTLYGITFSSQDLRIGVNVIPAANVSFVPSFIDSIKPGQSYPVYARVNIPYGTYATTYSGYATATNQTGTTHDTVKIIVTVTPYYDLDISDNEQNLIGNKMSLAGSMGDSTNVGLFRLVNPNSAALNVDPDQYGNASFTSLTSVATVLHYIPVTGQDIDTMIAAINVNVTIPTELASGASSDGRVRVRIPLNQLAGTYRGLVTVTGTPGEPGTPTDFFILEVYVAEVADLDIDSAAVHSSTNQGNVATTTSFHVWSTDAVEGHNPDPDGPGNVTLYGVTFSASDLRAGTRIIPAANVSFVPGSFDSIPVGTSKTVYARVNVPYGTYATTYSGMATAVNASGTTSDTVRIFVVVNPSYDLDISDNEQNLTANKMRLAGSMGAVVQGYFRLINPDRPENNVDPDPYGNADFTSVNYTSTLLSLVTSSPTEINTTIPASAVTFFDTIQNLTWGTSRNVGTRVTIPMNTLAGTYRGTVTVSGLPGEVSDNFTLEVVVSAIQDLDIDVASVSGSGNQGTTVTTATFRIYSTDAGEGNNPDPDGPGNTTLYGITISANDLRAGNHVITANNIAFVPSSIESLYPGTYQTVYARVNVPYGTYATTYTGAAIAQNNTGSTQDSVIINVTINPAYDLDIADNQANLVSNTMTLSLIPNTSASGQFLLINPDRYENNVDPDPYGNTDLTGINYRVTPTLTSFDGYTLSGSAITVAGVSTLAWGASQYITVTANIENAQHYATYYGYVTVYKTVNEADVISDSFILEVAVGPLDAFGMPDTITVIGNAGEFADTSFYVVNTGNKTIDRIELFPMTDFYAQGSEVSMGTKVRIPKENIAFTPPIIIDSMRVGESTEVTVRVDIPRLTMSGIYSARAKAMQERGDPAKNYIIILKVNYQDSISVGVTVSDNPVTGAYVNIGYYGDDGAKPKLTIMNMAAEIVLTKEFELKYGKSDVFTWNLTNNNGKLIASGMYAIILQTTINGKDKVFTKKVLVVK